jgi:hypothetical protein
VQLCKYGDPAVPLRNDHAVVAESFQPPHNRRRLGPVAELPEQPRRRRCVLGAGVPDQRDEDRITTGGQGRSATSLTTCPFASFDVTVRVVAVTDTSA